MSHRFPLHCLALWLAAIALPGWGATPTAPQGGVKVMHWWVAGGERASMNAVRDHALLNGVGWAEHSSAGSGTARYTEALAKRRLGPEAPTVAQMIGFEIHAWARKGLLENLDDIAMREEWDEVVPMDIQRLSKWNGSWVATPFNAHSTNWLWVNKALAQQLGAAQAPDGWSDLIALLDKAKASGVLPLAIGHEAWEHTLLFESVAVGVGGAQFYRKAFIDLDPGVLDEARLTLIFDRMKQLAGYLGPRFPTRRWDEATTLVSRGEALLQVQGSWVDGEFTAMGLAPGREYVCWRFPDTQGVYLFNSDQFVFLRQPQGRQPAQAAFATVVMGPALQEDVNLRTGAAPARVDVSNQRFNSCGRRNITDMRNANMRRAMMGSIAMGNANPPAVKTAIYEVVSRHFKGELNTPDAVKALHGAIAQASR